MIPIHLSMKWVLTLTFLYLLNISANAKSVFIETDKELEKALEIYQLYLDGHSKSEIEKEMGFAIIETNHHQVLDQILYFIETKQNKREDIHSCREDFIPTKTELERLDKNVRQIKMNLDLMYMDYTDFSDPFIKSCEFCFIDQECLAKHNTWQKENLNNKNQYTEFQVDYQKEFCRQMALYAQEDARPQTTRQVSSNDNAGLSFTISKNSTIDFIYQYDFSLCQKKQLFCPDLDPNIQVENSFLHPSCFAKDDAYSMQEVQEKVNWMNEFSNKVLLSCPQFPLTEKKLSNSLESKQLFTCFDKEFQMNPNNSTVLNLNIDEIISSNVKESVREIEFDDGSKEQVPLTEFHKKRIALYSQYKEVKEEIQKEQISKEIQQLFSQELESLKSSNPKANIGAYVNSLEGTINFLKYNDRFDKKIPDFSNQKIVSEVMVEGDFISDFPSDENTLNTLTQFLTQKVSKLISEDGRVTEKNQKDIDAVAAVWAYDCIQAYFKSLKCNDSYPITPDCSQCPEELKASDYTSNGESNKVTKKLHKKQFYKGRKCVDFSLTAKGQKLDSKAKQKACSEDLNLPGKNFIQTKPKSCQ